MFPSLWWYLGMLAAMPIILAGVLWLARQDMRRTITVLAATALGIGLATILLYVVLLKSFAANQYGVVTGSASFAPAYLLLAIEQIVIEVTWTLQSASWVLSLYHAIQARRGRWLALILACAVVSSVAAYFATNLYTLSYLAGVGPISLFVLVHPYASLFAAGVLSLLASGATLLYALVGVSVSIGVSGGEVKAKKANGLVPGAVKAATREARAAVLQADGAPEDVVFVVEDVPHGRG